MKRFLKSNSSWSITREVNRVEHPSDSKILYRSQKVLLDKKIPYSIFAYLDLLPLSIFKQSLVIKSFIVTAFFCVAFSGCMHRSQKNENLGLVAYGDLTQRVTVPGTISSNRKTIISAPYNGYIRKIYVQVGQKVEAGAPIVSVAQSFKSQNEEIFPIRSPFKGTVAQVLKTEGEYVEQNSVKSTSLGGALSGSSLVRIDDLSRLYVDANVPEIDIDKLSAGQNVIIRSNALIGKTYSGKINHVFLAAKEQTDYEKSKVDFSATIEVNENDGHLKPGMSAIVDIITFQVKHVLLLCHEFIRKEENQYFVTLKDGTKRKIEVGIQNEESFEIKDGLKEGDYVQQTDFLAVLKEKSQP